MYSELLHITQLPGPPRVRYTRMLNMLRRICLEQSAGFKSDYATLFSRLLAVCQYLNIDHRAADRFRRNARLVTHEELLPTPEQEKADLADLCHFIKQVTGSPIPNNLPQCIRPLRAKSLAAHPERCLKGVVTEVLPPSAFRCRVDDMEDCEYRIEFREDKDTPDERRLTTRYIYPGANVMLLDTEAKQGEAGTLCVYMVIVEPDYLIDVSALTAAVKAYGSSPLNYLLNQFEPRTVNRYNLLGDMANQFMDDCVNGRDDHSSMQGSIRKSYQQHLLDYACLTDEDIPADFFEWGRTHYRHIQDSVAHRFEAPDIGILRENVLLEPSFICPQLGLRGRLDVMTTDHLRVLELKSGRAEEMRKEPVAPKPDHLLQMTLYGEILRRNFHIPWENLQTFLFYSRYPRLYHERPSASAIREILDLRNGIMFLKYQLRQGNFLRLLPLLKPEHLNKFELSGKYYEQYLRPQIEAATRPLQGLRNDAPLCQYVSQFLTFIEREQFMSKTSDSRPDSLRGFASAWTADLRAKLLAGNLLTQLSIIRLHEDEDGAVESIEFKLADYDGETVPNFAVGEMVQLYEAADHRSNMTNHQLIRGVVSDITSETIRIELAYKQRNKRLFDQQKLYSVEHDATDSPFAQQTRNLFALVTALPRRRDLLLGCRKPEADHSRTLLGEYPEAVSRIILHAKQARDLYLLVGPPGTGKTNIALKAMVQEFLLTRQAGNDSSHGSLLLSAYTNRAVDEICAMLDRLSAEMNFDYLRIGSKLTCAAQHHSHLLGERASLCPKRQDTRRLIDHVPVIVGTVLTLTNNQILFKRKHFGAAIIDEASQLLEPQALGLFCAQNEGKDAIDKFILIGDHKQLPAVVMLPERQTQVNDPLLNAMGINNLRNSLFERLHGWLQRNGWDNLTGTLNRQGRMHPAICQFVSHQFYADSLTAVPLPHQSEALPWTKAIKPYERFVASTRLGFVDVASPTTGENLRANAAEAEVVCQLVKAICSLHELNGVKPFQPEKAIGIIVPFRSQIAAIRSTLLRNGLAWAAMMTIDTVECYQGSQRDYIIFSTTISESYQLSLLSSVQDIGGTEVDRKLNVALTRARRQMFIVGNRPLLLQSPLYKALINACQILEA